MAKVSTKGYKKNSKDKNEPHLRIPSNMITMKEDDGTPLRKGPILGIDNLGNQQLMMPGADYQFPGNYVDEIPMAKMGGTKKVRIHSLPKAQKGLTWSEYLKKRGVTDKDMLAITQEQIDQGFNGLEKQEAVNGQYDIKNDIYNNVLGALLQDYDNIYPLSGNGSRTTLKNVMSNYSFRRNPQTFGLTEKEVEDLYRKGSIDAALNQKYIDMYFNSRNNYNSQELKDKGDSYRDVPIKWVDAYPKQKLKGIENTNAEFPGQLRVDAENMFRMPVLYDDQMLGQNDIPLLGADWMRSYKNNSSRDFHTNPAIYPKPNYSIEGVEPVISGRPNWGSSATINGQQYTVGMPTQNSNFDQFQVMPASAMPGPSAENIFVDTPDSPWMQNYKNKMGLYEITQENLARLGQYDPNYKIQSTPLSEADKRVAGYESQYINDPNVGFYQISNEENNRKPCKDCGTLFGSTASSDANNYYQTYDVQYPSKEILSKKDLDKLNEGYYLIPSGNPGVAVLNYRKNAGNGKYISNVLGPVHARDFLNDEQQAEFFGPKGGTTAVDYDPNTSDIKIYPDMHSAWKVIDDERGVKPRVEAMQQKQMNQVEEQKAAQEQWEKEQREKQKKKLAQPKTIQAPEGFAMGGEPDPERPWKDKYKSKDGNYLYKSVGTNGIQDYENSSVRRTLKGFITGAPKPNDTPARKVIAPASFQTGGAYDYWRSIPIDWDKYMKLKPFERDQLPIEVQDAYFRNSKLNEKRLDYLVNNIDNENFDWGEESGPSASDIDAEFGPSPDIHYSYDGQIPYAGRFNKFHTFGPVSFIGDLPEIRIPSGKKYSQNYIDWDNYDPELRYNYFKTRDEVNDFYKNWYSKRAMLPQFTEVANRRLAGLPNVEFQPYGSQEEYDEDNPGTGGVYKRSAIVKAPIRNAIYLPPSAFNDPSIMTHEESHYLDYNYPQNPAGLLSPSYNQEDAVLDNIIPQEYKQPSSEGDDSVYKSSSVYLPFANEEEMAASNSFAALFGSGQELTNYYYNPTEIRARLNEWRKKHNIDPLKEYTDEEMQNIIDTDVENNDGSNFDLYKIIRGRGDLLKKIHDSQVSTGKKQNPDAVPQAKKGGSLIKKQNGGDISIPDLRRVKIDSLPKAQKLGQVKLNIPANLQQKKLESNLNFNPKLGINIPEEYKNTFDLRPRPKAPVNQNGFSDFDFKKMNQDLISGSAVAESTRPANTFKPPLEWDGLTGAQIIDQMKAQAAYDALPEAAKRHDTLTADTRSDAEKFARQAWTAISHPMETISAVSRGYDIPSGYLGMGNPYEGYGVGNPMTSVLDMVAGAPGFVANAIYRQGEKIVDNPGEYLLTNTLGLFDPNYRNEALGNYLDLSAAIPASRAAATPLVKSATKAYDKVATGNSFIDRAWKVERPNFPIKSTDYIARPNTDVEIGLLNKFGKGMKTLTPEEWAGMENLTRSGATDFSKGDYPISRILGYYDRGSAENKLLEGLKVGDVFHTPTEKTIRTWSVGTPGKGDLSPFGNTRLVIPSKYTKGLGNNFGAMPYNDKRLPFIWNPETGEINSMAVAEKEIMGNIPKGFKVIGTSKENGLRNLIIKPLKEGGSLPKAQFGPPDWNYKPNLGVNLNYNPYANSFRPTVDVVQSPTIDVRKVNQQPVVAESTMPANMPKAPAEWKGKTVEQIKAEVKAAEEQLARERELAERDVIYADTRSDAEKLARRTWTAISHPIESITAVNMGHDIPMGSMGMYNPYEGYDVGGPMNFLMGAVAGLPGFLVNAATRQGEQIVDDPLKYTYTMSALGMIDPDTRGQAFSNMLDLSAVIPAARATVGPLVKNAGTFLTTQTPLRYASKYNPFRWKPDSNSFYHRNPDVINVVNQETGMLQSWADSPAGKAYTEANLAPFQGINLRRGAKSNMSFSKGVPLDGVYSTSKYPGPYLLEVSGENVPFRQSAKGFPVSETPGSFTGSYNVPARPISLDDVKFYREHWLHGYTPIPAPTLFDEMMSTAAPKGNMYGQNQVLTQRARLLNPAVKKKFFENQAPEPEAPTSIFQKSPKDLGNRITPENYEDFVNRIHGSTDYGPAVAPKTGANLGIGNYGKPGMVYQDAPLNNLGKDIINAHEKNHGIFAGTLSPEMETALLKPFGTRTPIPHYSGKHQADEVLARMGQFKNAVGIGDNQTFTLGHLNLIRKNYADQFIDNGITEMLAKLKPGSNAEKEFLINMNKFAFGLTGAGLTGFGIYNAQPLSQPLEQNKKGGQAKRVKINALPNNWKTK